MGYDVFERLCQEKGVKPYHVSKETGVATATLTEWKNGTYTPKTEKLQKIADFFGVTIDYLLTGKEPEGDHYTVQEKRLLAYYRALTDGNKKIIENTMKALSATSENEASAS